MVRGFIPVDRIQGLSPVGGIDWIVLVGRLDRIGCFGAIGRIRRECSLASVVAVLAIGHVRTGQSGCSPDPTLNALYML